MPGLITWTVAGIALTAALVAVVRRSPVSRGSPDRFRIADWLTILRLALIAPTVRLLAKDQFVAAAILYGVLLATDVADGIVARRRGESTPFGVFLDPLADILSTFAVFTVFVIDGFIPLWLYLLLLFRYLMLGVGSLALARTTGPIEFHATVPGKIVGVVQAGAALWIMHAAAMGLARPPGDGPLFAFLGVGFLSIVVSQAVIGYRHTRAARGSHSGSSR